MVLLLPERRVTAACVPLLVESVELSNLLLRQRSGPRSSVVCIRRMSRESDVRGTDVDVVEEQ
eukprot:1912333-Rhodomonas_salina.1